MDKISIDLGYGSTKVKYNNIAVKFPTAIAYYNDNGLKLNPETHSIYDYKGKKYIVGSATEGLESFSTTDYNFLKQFAPLIIYHVLSKFKLVNKPMPLQLNTGLALVDWDKKDDFVESLKSFEVNGDKIEMEIKITPQGFGVYLFSTTKIPDVKEMKITIIDIGYNTINLLRIDKNKPRPELSKSYPGHGVSSIAKQLKSYLENTYKINLSSSDVNEYLMTEKFRYQGELKEDVTEFIKKIKQQFVVQLFNSVLVDDKKTLGLSDIVIIAGGGSYFLQSVKLPGNVKFIKVEDENPQYEYLNVLGYDLM